YVYVLLPLAGEPTLVFPGEARWIGDKAKPWVKNQVWPDIPGQWIRERGRECGWKRVGVYGMNFIMAVRDYRELCHGQFELIPFDFQFDMARAVKSQEELAEVRDAMDIILDGFWALVAAYEPGKTEAEIMAPAVERFFARGAGPRMMSLLLSGPEGEAAPAFKVPCHHAIADAFAKHSFVLGHLSGHSIGATMIEHPSIGSKSDVQLEENMIFSLHPQVVDKDGKVCLYTQDTYRIGKTEGECLADVPWKFFTGEEAKARVAD